MSNGHQKHEKFNQKHEEKCPTATTQQIVTKSDQKHEKKWPTDTKKMTLKYPCCPCLLENYRRKLGHLVL